MATQVPASPLDRALDTPPVATPSTSLLEAIEIIGQGSLSCRLRDSSNRKTPALAGELATEGLATEELATEEPVTEELSLETSSASCLLVVDSTGLVGIFTAQDLIRVIGKGQDLAALTLAEVMSERVVTLSASDCTTLATALSTMSAYRIHHLPITDKTGQVLGLITPSRLRRLFATADFMQVRQVREVMNSSVAIAQPTDSMRQVAKAMAQQQASYVLIAKQETARPDNLKPVGIITARDVVQFQLLALDTEKTQAQTVMSSPLFTASPLETLSTVSLKMQRLRVQQLIVVSNQGNLLGTVSQDSLLPLDAADITQWTSANCTQAAAPTEAHGGQGQDSSRQLRAAQQSAIAQLAQLALSTGNVDELINRCVTETASVLNVDYCKVLEHWPSQGLLWLRAGIGWKPGLAGQATIEDKKRSQAGYALASAGPVVVEDLRLETRFSGSALLLAHQVVSGISAIIQGQHRPYGVLGVHTRQRRAFSEDDVHFVQSVANIIASAIERRQVESTLSQSQAQFRTLVDTVPVGIFLTDAQGGCQFVNACWQQLTGLSPAEAAGNGWVKAIHPSDRGRIWTEWNALTQNNQEFFSEYRFLTPTGQTIWVTGRAIATLDESGQIAGYLGTVTDIGDRKQAEAKLKEQAALLDIATDAILVRDNQGRIAFWSKGAEALYGWSAAEAIGKVANRLLYLDEPDNKEIYQSLARIGSWQGERHQVTKSGQTITVMSRWTQVEKVLENAPEGELETAHSILTVNTDITQAKQLEVQFLRAQRLESVGTLASGIAHDLNNILTPIYGVAHLLPLQFPNADEKMQQQFQILQTSARRGSEIIRQVLSFSRGMEGDRVPVSIKHVIAEIKSFIRKTFPKSIEVSVDLPKDLRMVMGDITQLHQVFMNFFVNARDAMPEGGLLTLSATNLQIDQSFAEAHLEAQLGTYILVTVADTGIGIAPDQLDRIFEPFFTTKQNKGGTGLGLSTAHGIIKSHGGFITVYSEIDRGTQFNVYLPAIENRNVAAAEPAEYPAGNGECILIVDDEAPIRDVARSVLENYHYRVLVAESGIDAIAQYAQNYAQQTAQNAATEKTPQADAIQVVLMDMTMPDLGGPKTIQVLQKINPQLKVVMVSGLPGNQQIANAIGGIVKGFIQKPYSSATLLKTLRDVLDER